MYKFKAPETTYIVHHNTFFNGNQKIMPSILFHLIEFIGRSTIATFLLILHIKICICISL